MADRAPDMPAADTSPHAVTGRSNLRAILIVMLSFAIFSGTDVMVKLMAEGVPVAQVTFLITAVALVLSVAQAVIGGTPRDLVPRYPVLAFLRAGLLSVDTLLIYYAFTRLSLSEVYMIAFTTPIMVAGLAALFLGERLSLAAWCGILVGFAGVVLALRPGVEPLNLGHAAAFGAALCFAFSLILLRRAKAAESDTALVVTLLFVLLVMSGAVTMASGGFAPVDDHGWVQALAGGVMLFGGHMLLVRAFRAGDASVIAPFQYSQIIWGCLYGLFVFNTPVQPFTLAGAAVIIFSGWLVLR